MQFMTPMQLFVWILGLVAASGLIIGLMSEWIFRIWFNAKKRFIADIAMAAGKAAESLAAELSEKAKADKDEKAQKIAELFFDQLKKTVEEENSRQEQSGE